MNLIIDTIQSYLPPKHKRTPSGWISFNAPCCNDKRQRGGLIFNQGDAVSYHCFNCGFKASWQPGRHLSQKMNKLLRWFNVSDDLINQLRLEALKIDQSSTQEIRSIIPKFDHRALPPDSISILELLDSPPEKLLPILEYLIGRGIYPQDYDFYWTPKVGFSNRVIIPFYKDNIVVGYTARAVNDAKPKYISEQQPGYVFNLDKQQNNRKYAIVCEGPFDALSIEGCALLGSEIKDSQNYLLKQLGKELVLVPDRDHEGLKTVEQALEYGWSVSMPEWPDNVKDINDSVRYYGRLYTLYMIVSSIESNKLKIQLKSKNWFKKEENEKAN
jgi:hypothetical protein